MNFRKFPKCCGIYKIINTVNNKVYVGYAKNIRTRCKCHRVELRAGKHKNSHLQNAWNVYGEISFQFSILELCTIDQLASREDHWCKLLNTHNREIGYNIKDTGADVYNHSEETKKKIGAANKGKKYYGDKNPFYGRKHSEETKVKMLNSRDPHKVATNAWKTKKEKGYVVSDITREKLRIANKGRAGTANKKVIEINSNIIFNSVKEAANYAGIGVDSMIDRLKGRTKITTYKYYENGL